MDPHQERAEASGRKKRTSTGKWNRKRAKKAAGEKPATKLADLKAELEAARCEVRAMRAIADGLNDEVSKLTADKARLENVLETESAV